MLVSVTIGEDVTTIGADAFSSCSGLIEVCNLSKLSITAGSIDNGYVGNYAKHIIQDPADSYLKESNGYLFYEDGSNSYLMGYTGSETNLTLPEKTPTGKNYEIYLFAFYGRSDLRSITIPDSVTSIGRSAFCIAPGSRA